ncbi:hypothetical protein FX982_00794 [Pseudomonas graminis]|uniref:Uncharacterized protein n=1 Tax=Pseudomonas graminis TaxID=158627 RepID=A0A6M8M491_9PSED|nr:hypothetical protein FX982_00794 [Pseudomonas graminis]
MTQGREQTHSPREIWIRSIYSLSADILSQARAGDTQPV